MLISSGTAAVLVVAQCDALCSSASTKRLCHTHWRAEPIWSEFTRHAGSSVAGASMPCLDNALQCQRHCFRDTVLGGCPVCCSLASLLLGPSVQQAALFPLLLSDAAAVSACDITVTNEEWLSALMHVEASAVTFGRLLQQSTKHKDHSLLVAQQVHSIWTYSPWLYCRRCSMQLVNPKDNDRKLGTVVFGLYGKASPAACQSFLNFCSGTLVSRHPPKV